MSFRLPSVLALAVAAASFSTGCATVTAEKYARDMDALRRYNEQLVQQNQALLSQNEGMGRQLDDTVLARTSDELYSQLARQLQTALDSLRNGETGGMTFNPRTGAWEMGTDLLFESGSAKVRTPRAASARRCAAPRRTRARFPTPCR